MKRRKQISKLVLIFFSFTVIFTGENTHAGAQSLVVPPFASYLPMVMKPGYIFVPLVLNNYPQPPIQVGPYGGSVVALATDPTNAGTLYAGSYGDGVFKSTDGGSTWYSHKAGMGNLYITSLAIDPKETDNIYAGTQAGGVYKSNDGGVNWSLSNSGIQSNAVVYSLNVNTGNHDIILAGTRGENNTNSPPWHGVVYRSTNGGQSWSAVLTNIGGSGAQDWVYSLAVNATSPSEVFAASHEHGPYRSEDYGASWTAVGGSMDGSGRAVAVDPRSSQAHTVYYAVWHRTGVYKSTNSGSSWGSTSNGLGEAKVYPSGFVLAPTQPDTIYLADFTGLGVMKSTNGAGNWNSDGLGGIYIYSVAVSPTDPSSVIAGTLSHGLYRSTNGGGSWSSSQVGFTNTQVTGMVSAANALYSSTRGGGVFKSTDQGATWASFNSGLDDLQVNGLVASPAQANVLFALTDSGLYRSDVKTGTWSSLSNRLPAPSALISASGPVVTPYGPEHPFTRNEPGYDLLQENATAPLATGSGTASHAPVLALAFAPTRPEQVYMGSAGAGIFASSDGGSTWVSAGLANATVWSLSVQPQLLAAAVKDSASVEISTDSGKTWSESGQPDASVSTVYTVLLPSAQEPSLYAGTNNGVWLYNGQKWAPAGLAGTPVVVLVSDPNLPGRMFAGTTHGAYFSDDGTSWTSVSPALQDATIQSIHFDAASRSIVFGTTVQGALRVQAP